MVAPAPLASWLSVASALRQRRSPARAARAAGVALGATRTVGQERLETAVDARRVGAGARASDAARAMRPTDRGEAQRRRASAAAGDASGQVRLPLAHPKLG